jgi:hypothetical protein
VVLRVVLLRVINQLFELFEGGLVVVIADQSALASNDLTFFEDELQVC